MATLEHLLEYTSAGIPVSLRPFFQEYRLEDLDPEGSAFTVMERTLGWGNIPDRILRSRPKELHGFSSRSP